MALRATEHPMAVPDHTYDPGHKAPAGRDTTRRCWAVCSHELIDDGAPTDHERYLAPIRAEVVRERGPLAGAPAEESAWSISGGTLRARAFAQSRATGAPPPAHRGHPVVGWGYEDAEPRYSS